MAYRDMPLPEFAEELRPHLVQVLRDYNVPDLSDETLSQVFVPLDTTSCLEATRWLRDAGQLSMGDLAQGRF